MAALTRGEAKLAALYGAVKLRLWAFTVTRTNHCRAGMWCGSGWAMQIRAGLEHGCSRLGAVLSACSSQDLHPHFFNPRRLKKTLGDGINVVGSIVDNPDDAGVD
jgi:hypothetical protein